MSQDAPSEAPMRRALFTVAAIVFVDLLGVIIPILPYYVRSFGEGPLFAALIGLLAGSYSLLHDVHKFLPPSVAPPYGFFLRAPHRNLRRAGG